jgi:hypothetical protein
VPRTFIAMCRELSSRCATSFHRDVPRAFIAMCRELSSRCAANFHRDVPQAFIAMCRELSSRCAASFHRDVHVSERIWRNALKWVSIKFLFKTQIMAVNVGAGARRCKNQIQVFITINTK